MSWLDQIDARVVAAAAVLAGSLLLGLLVRRTVLRRLEARVRSSPRAREAAFVMSLRRPILLWFLLGGGYLVVQVIGVPSTWTSTTDKVSGALLVVSLTVWLADLGVRLLTAGTVASDSQAAPVTSVVRVGVRVAVFAVGILVLLDTLGISITPVLTTIGIGGIAVALGLQDTLSSLFAGIHLTLAKNLRVGDFVQLEGGQEGYIEDIRWRATRLRTIESNIVLVPNNKLAQNIVTNFHLPAPSLAVVVEVGVHYASDLDQVERIACEVASSVMKTVKGGVAEFEPFVRYHEFGDSSIDLSVTLRAHHFADTVVVKHEFIKALARRFAREGIVIPFPISALNLDQERTARPRQ